MSRYMNEMRNNGIIKIPDNEIEKSLKICDEIRKNSDREKYCFVESYGCQMNDHDAERLIGMLKLMGYTMTEDKSLADFIIFNTCCVREHAEKRVFGNIGALKKLKDEKPDLIIGVCGCMMQQKEVALRTYKRFPFVNMIFGTHELHKFPQMMQIVLSGERVIAVRDIDGEVPEGLPTVRQNGFSTNVIVMYGCNNFCSYCIVPYVRGRERARTSADIMNEVRSLAQSGYKEITLLGQNVNSYRSESGEDFSDILRLVNEVDGIERIRFMTSHPKDLSDRLIYAMAECDKVCSHIHLPVQSGNDRILKEMNRHYDRAHYIERVSKLREHVKDVEITTDIIVGFPTETDAEFEDTVSLVREVGYAAAYTFMYSPRKGTRAAEMENQVPEETKKQRLFALNAAVADVLRKRNERYTGMTGAVLVEGVDMREKPVLFGKLSNFKMVYFDGNPSLVGTMVNVQVTGAQTNSLIGKLMT